MKRICAILSAVLLILISVSSCGSDGSREAGSIINKQADAMEDYVNGLTDAKNADDLVKAIDGYTKDMKDLIPDILEFQNKYPEYREGKVPEGLETDVRRMEELSEKIPGAMMKMTRYMMDSKVQEAMTRMGEELGKLEQ